LFITRILVHLQHAPSVIVALVHLETRDALVVAQRVVRGPKRLTMKDSQRRDTSLSKAEVRALLPRA
jgi:hypothetical protein